MRDVIRLGCRRSGKLRSFFSTRDCSQNIPSQGTARVLASNSAQSWQMLMYLVRIPRRRGHSNQSNVRICHGGQGVLRAHVANRAQQVAGYSERGVVGFDSGEAEPRGNGGVWIANLCAPRRRPPKSLTKRTEPPTRSATSRCRNDVNGGIGESPVGDVGGRHRSCKSLSSLNGFHGGLCAREALRVIAFLEYCLSFCGSVVVRYVI